MFWRQTHHGATGNKGEWSEFYAFLKLLSLGLLYGADENGNRLNSVAYPIIKIMRDETGKAMMTYVIETTRACVEVHCDKGLIHTLPQKELAHMASFILNAVRNADNRAFSIDQADSFMEELSCSKITTSSKQKADITLQLHDIHTGYQPICGVSIKSELGHAPTLLNASGATNFVFDVIGIQDAQMGEINAIETKNKIIDRIQAICRSGSLRYVKLDHETFAQNLLLIDSQMDQILAHLLCDFYQNGVGNCESLIQRQETENPLNYPRAGIYAYKFKKFLCAIALGLMPSKVWNGYEEANGGYILVKTNGDVVAFHIYNRNAFEDYLLSHTKLEKASTSRHGFAHLYKSKAGQKQIKLNLQIRFMS